MPLEADAGEAGFVDVAFPLPEFEPLRLNARCSSGAEIQRSPKRVTVRIADLGATRSGFGGGRVSAKITLHVESDGRSIIHSCEVMSGWGWSKTPSEWTYLILGALGRMFSPHLKRS